jgi:hypothetical protein
MMKQTSKDTQPANVFQQIGSEQLVNSWYVGFFVEVQGLVAMWKVVIMATKEM